jgi:hypothetical protein
MWLNLRLTFITTWCRRSLRRCWNSTFEIGRTAVFFNRIFLTSRQSNSSATVLDQLSALFPEARNSRSLSYARPENALECDHKILSDSFQKKIAVLISTAGPKKTMKFLVRAVDRDFRDGRVIVVHGWTLSQTELDLLVLMGLIK